MEGSKKPSLSLEKEETINEIFKKGIYLDQEVIVTPTSDSRGHWKAKIKGGDFTRGVLFVEPQGTSGKVEVEMECIQFDTRKHIK